MSAMTPLHRLAAAHYIEPSYEDIWQERHETSAETKRTLQRAMGVRAWRLRDGAGGAAPRHGVAEPLPSENCEQADEPLEVPGGASRPRPPHWPGVKRRPSSGPAGRSCGTP